MTRPRNPRPATLPGQRPVPLWALILLAVCPIAASTEPARAVPARGLAVYVEYDGIDAHADAWKATAACAMFERTPAGAMIADITRQVVDRLLKALPDQEPVGADLLALQEHILRHGFSLGLYDETERGASCVVVLNGLGRGEARERVGRLARIATHAVSKPDGEVAETSRFQGRDLYWVKDLAAATPKVEAPDAPKAATKTPTDGLAWWFEGNDLIVVTGPTPPKADGAKNDASAPLPLRVASVIDTIEGEASSVATHPGRAAALAEGQDIKGFESDGLFFIEVSKAQGVYARLSERIGGMYGPYEGLTLPSGKYMHDDVQYFAPGPDLPFANTQAATQKARMQAMGIDPKTAVPPAEAPPKAALTPPLTTELPPPAPPALAEIPGPKDVGRDPAVLKAGTIPGSNHDGKKKNAVNTAKALGLDGVTRIVGRWGFQGKALLTNVRVEVPSPRRGLVSMLDQTGFRKDRLPPIPQGAGAFLIGSCDPVKTYDALLSAGIKNLDLSGAGGDGDEFSKMVELLVFEATGQRLHEDILGHFGPTWCLYAEPQPKKGKTDTRMPTLLVEVDDAKAFGKVLDSLAKRVNAYLHTTLKGDDGKPADGPPAIALEPLSAPERGYRLTSPAGVVSWLGEGQQPTVQVGESYVAFAANPALTRAALAAASRSAERWGPSGELAKAFECLPAEMTSLTVGDPDDSAWPEIVVYLPKLVQHIASSFEVIEGDPPGSSPGSKFLGLLGIPRAGGFRLRIDPAKAPKADALRAQLFPSVLATAVDDRGIRFIAREAIPFACAGPGFRYRGSTKDGETLAIELSPFLFPCFRAEMKHNLKKEGGTFTFGMKGKFAPNEGSDD